MTTLRKQVIICTGALSDISKSLWIIRDKLTFVFRSSDPHSTLRRISSKAKAAIHLEGESQLTFNLVLSKHWAHALAFKGTFQTRSSTCVIFAVCVSQMLYKEVVA